MMTENKDNKDLYFIQKCLLINFAAYEGTIDTQTKKSSFCPFKTKDRQSANIKKSI